MDNRRKHDRSTVALSAEVEINGITLIGQTRDVSESGVAVILTQALPENRSVALTLILTQDGIEDPDELPFEAHATVVWAAPTDDGQAMMGLRFADVAPIEAERIKRFLAALRH